MVWSPPGLPGGGMTGMRCEPDGAGGVTCISGSTLCGGRITPFWRSSCWLGFSAVDGGAWPSVSDFGGGSRSIACAHAAGLASVAATAAAAAANVISGLVVRATGNILANVRRLPESNAGPAARVPAVPLRRVVAGCKPEVFQRLHNPVTLPYRLGPGGGGH